MRYKYDRNTPGMWIIFIVLLAASVGLTILMFNAVLFRAAGETLPTRVFTVGSNVVSLKIPNDWSFIQSDSDTVFTWQSKDGYESLSVSPATEPTLEEASLMYMLEIKGMFPDTDMSNLTYNESTINGKKAFAMNISYESKYYIIGVIESGETLVKFVYSASIMTGEISDIDVIIGSINYRKGGSINRE